MVYASSSGGKSGSQPQDAELRKASTQIVKTAVLQAVEQYAQEKPQTEKMTTPVKKGLLKVTAPLEKCEKKKR
ncbi:hypothetical protein AOXY_G3882 [Acipenser oxyrinchus oxyrinchus]|uniref:A-kinase anchor protein 7 RI-RII subunit-binding domain-containing protein n=1 Tax=Acipenser oxyrinchus oxyrinchus TaxID=40147 RepID=A0AAD8GFR3_ACIOX|nr:hypothetical protein AOXY_G3882 [Acipenser oxyrinchus oxyrinchus]